MTTATSVGHWHAWRIPGANDQRAMKGGGTLKTRRRSSWLLLLYVLVGAIVGSVVGRWLGAYWPLLGHNYVTLGAGTPWTLNLAVVGFALGAWVQLNLVGLLGLVAGVVAWGRS